VTSTASVALTLEAALSILLHDTTLFAASVGVTVAVKVSEAPTARDSEFLFKRTSLTETAVVEMVTVAINVSLLPT
jgi:hypothetical protein